MKGNISYIKNGSYGFINGEDLLEYFFDKDGLKNCTIYQLSEGDYVEFKIEIQLGQKRDKAVDIIKKSSTSYRSTDIAEPGIHPDFVFDAFNEDEKLIIEQLKKELYLTNGGGSIPIGRSDYRYCLAKPTRDFNLTFNLNREIVVVFADYVSFEPRSLDVAAVVAKERQPRLRIDKSCQIVISRDEEIEQKLAEILKDNNFNSIVIPFSYKELLDDPAKGVVMERFRKYLFEADLFAVSNPIEEDVFFFGRRDLVFDIVNKCKTNTHSGVFGLRRSGKTSLLYAVKRLLTADGYPTVYIPCQSQLSPTSWQLALYTIVSDIFNVTKVKGQKDRHSKQSYLEENAAVCFENDMMRIFSEIEKPIVLLFDEIEAITFGVPNENENWQNGDYYVNFWNTIRGFYLKHTQVISFVVAGTNPRINEVPIIKEGMSNPMYGQLSKSNQGAYLTPFNLSDTQNMVNTLGGYMGITFDEHVCSALTLDCGGHPYLIRLLCSFINRELKQQKAKRPKVVNIHTYKDALNKFEETNDATGFYLMILNILIENYIKEFNVLKEIAINGKEYISNFMDDEALLHLLGYGLIENSDGKYSIRFSTIARYLLGKYKYDRKHLSIEEQRQEINYRFSCVEIALRKAVKNTLQITMGVDAAKEIVIDAMGNHPGISARDIDKARNLTLSELFDPSVNKMYFHLLSTIIIENFVLFENVFNKKTKEEWEEIFSRLNKARKVPSHSYSEGVANWNDEDFEDFRDAIKQVEEILKAYD